MRRALLFTIAMSLDRTPPGMSIAIPPSLSHQRWGAAGPVQGYLLALDGQAR